MAIFQVHTIDTHADGRRRYLNVESSHATLDSFLAALREGPVVVEQLQAHRDGEEMRVTASRRVAITLALVTLIETVTIRFVRQQPDKVA